MKRAEVLAADLRYEQTPAIDAAALLGRVTGLAGSRVGILSRGGDEPLSLFEFPDLTTEFAEGPLPMQVSVFVSDAVSPLQPEAFAHARSWPEAQSTLANASASVLVSDLFAKSINPPARLKAWHAVVRAIVEASQPLGIRLLTADRIVPADRYLQSLDADPSGLAASVQVRLFHPPDGAATVMDTLGLGPLLLPDVQLHFTDLDPDDVARWLWNAAWYLFENGDVIDDGHTIAGIDPAVRWPCRHEVSMAAPERLVLDADPSPHGPRRH